MRDSIRHFLAEFIGTFGLVFITGAARISAEMRGSQAIVLESALAYGLALGALVTAMMRVGGHFNPAITLGFLAARRIDPMMSGLFIIAGAMDEECRRLIERAADPTPTSELVNRVVQLAQGHPFAAIELARSATTGAEHPLPASAAPCT